MTFYPDTLPLPQELRAASFVLKPLTPEYAPLDYEAYITSPEVIRVHSGGRWPIENFTLEDEREQLALHAQRHQARQDFAFIILDPAETRALGCVYVLPLHPFLRRMNAEGALADRGGENAAMITFWIRQSEQSSSLSEELVRAAWRWFTTEWLFSAVYFRINQAEVRAQQALANSGFTSQFTVCSADQLAFLFYA